jgi:hypothetical protein
LSAITSVTAEASAKSDTREPFPQSSAFNLQLSTFNQALSADSTDLRRFINRKEGKDHKELPCRSEDVNYE